MKNPKDHYTPNMPDIGHVAGKEFSFWPKGKRGIFSLPLRNARIKVQNSASPGIPPGQAI